MKKKMLFFFTLTMAAALIAILFLDRPLALLFESAFFKENYWQFLRTWTDVGLGENYFVISTVAFILSWIWKKRFLRQWSSSFFVCLLTSGIVLQIAKHLVGRQRPLATVNFDPLVFEPLNLNHLFHSMPSGHTQVIFCAATLFTILIPRLKWFWFLFAIFIGFTRVATQQHWLSDTFLGAYIGWAVSVLTLEWIKNREVKS